METASYIIIGVIAYIFIFELILSFKILGLNENKLPLPLNLQHSIWMKFSHFLGIVMSKIILTILWIIGFGPYAIIWKLGHLRKRKEKSYWVEISKEDNDMKYSF
ncbi:MAG: hypothetical protein KAS32_09980 [Candidatus Peribacteraceae bacterium]|nr:hypothetical protein [Candidatus Peribacteraceae bacterium]